MNTTDMFADDKKLGDLLKEVAIARVATAHSKWVDVAMVAVRIIAERRGEFTTDAVWHVLERAGIVTAIEPRAMGAAMRRASREGVCVPTPRTSKSVRPACHRRPLQVWRSLITKRELVSVVAEREVF